MATEDKDIREFALEDFKLNPISSTANSTKNPFSDKAEEAATALDALSENSAGTDLLDGADEAEDPIFKELARPQLPPMTKGNRARLQMQSPTKIFFYWSFRHNPFQILNRVFGRQTNYQLIAKLVDQRSDREQLFPIESEGSAWFDVDADGRYQVEVGFYAVSRPFVRVMFSNVVETPRKSPSPRQDYSEYFAVSADQFAKILDASGYSQDAFEVALAGDDVQSADEATGNAFRQMLGELTEDFDKRWTSELRLVLLALASGYTLEDLRELINPSLFVFLQKYADRLNVETAFAALQENFAEFDDETSDEEIEEFAGAPVFGVSLVNFPRFSKRRLKSKFPSRFASKFSPLSSLR